MELKPTKNSESDNTIIACNRSLMSARQIHGLSSTSTSSALFAKTITRINIHMNQLTTLEGLEGCVNLVSLDASSNSLGKMDSTLLNFSKLQELNLSGNCISTIDNLSRMRDLRRLSLAFNQITHLKGLHQLPMTLKPSAGGNMRVSLPSSRNASPSRSQPSSLVHTSSSALGPALEYLDIRCNRIGSNELAYLHKHAPHSPRNAPSGARRDELKNLPSRHHHDQHNSSSSRMAGLEVRGHSAMAPPNFASNTAADTTHEESNRMPGEGVPPRRNHATGSRSAKRADSPLQARITSIAAAILQPLSVLTRLRELKITYHNSRGCGEEGSEGAERINEGSAVLFEENPLVVQLAHQSQDHEGGDGTSASGRQTNGPLLLSLLAKIAPQLSRIDEQSVGFDVEHISAVPTQSSTERQQLSAHQAPALAGELSPLSTTSANAVRLSQSFDAVAGADGSVTFLSTADLRRAIDERLRDLEAEYDSYLASEKEKERLNAEAAAGNENRVSRRNSKIAVGGSITILPTVDERARPRTRPLLASASSNATSSHSSSRCVSSPSSTRGSENTSLITAAPVAPAQGRTRSNSSPASQNKPHSVAKSITMEDAGTSPIRFVRADHSPSPAPPPPPPQIASSSRVSEDHLSSVAGPSETPVDATVAESDRTDATTDSRSVKVDHVAEKAKGSKIVVAPLPATVADVNSVQSNSVPLAASDGFPSPTIPSHQINETFHELLKKEASSLRNELMLRDHNWSLKIEEMRREELTQRELVLRTARDQWQQEHRRAMAQLEAQLTERLTNDLTFRFEKEKKEAIELIISREKDDHRRVFHEYKARKTGQFQQLQKEVDRLLKQCAAMGSECQMLSVAHQKEMKEALSKQEEQLEAQFQKALREALGQQASDLHTEFARQFGDRIGHELHRVNAAHQLEMQNLQREMEISFSQREAIVLAKEDDRHAFELRQFMQRAEIDLKALESKMTLMADGHRDALQLASASFADLLKAKTRGSSQRIDMPTQTYVSAMAVPSAGPFDALELIQPLFMRRSESTEALLAERDAEVHSLRKELFELREEQRHAFLRVVNPTPPLTSAATETVTPSGQPALANDATSAAAIIEQHSRTIANLKASLEAKDEQLGEIEAEAMEKIEQKRAQIRNLEDSLDVSREKNELLQEKLSAAEKRLADKMAEEGAQHDAQLAALKQATESEIQQRLTSETALLDAEIRGHYEVQMSASVEHLKTTLAAEMQTKLDVFKKAFAESMQLQHAAEKEQLIGLIDALRAQLQQVHDESQLRVGEVSYLRLTVLPEMKEHMAVLQKELDRYRVQEAKDRERLLRQEKALKGALQELSLDRNVLSGY